MLVPMLHCEMHLDCSTEIPNASYQESEYCVHQSREMVHPLPHERAALHTECRSWELLIAIDLSGIALK